MKKVSIIIPVYNGEKYIVECLESILNQTYDNIEIIIVDDGSNDNTKKILEKYKGNKKIVLNFQNNLGAPTARNNGYKISTGEYILFFDADDYMEKEYIENATKIMDKGYELVISNFNRIDENGNIKKWEFRKKDGFSTYENLYFISPFPNNKLYLRKIIDDNEIIFDDLRMAQDLNFYLKYLQCTNKVGFNESFDLFYRIHSNSITTNYSLKIFDIEKSLNKVKKYLLDENKEIFTCARLYHYNSQLKKYNHYNKKDKKEIIKFFKDIYVKNNISKLSKKYKGLMNKHYFYIYCMFILPYPLKSIFNKMILRRLK